MLQKRYQYYSPHGIAWTPWFSVSDRAERTKAQLGTERKPKLLNEYRTVKA